jgi:hypothetical protein
LSPEERQDERASVVRDLRILLTTEADLGATALAAAQAGSLERLAEVSDLLLSAHLQYAVKYRKLLALWLRPGHPDSDIPGGVVIREEPVPRPGSRRNRPAGTSRWPHQ